jgi:uncharacterized protein
MLLKTIALRAIELYQKYLSPRKGFSCAYRVHAGGMGCSGFGKHAIRKHGFFLGLVLLRRRLAKCSWHAHQHTNCSGAPSPQVRVTYAAGGRFKNQGGFVDADCGGCDAPDCDLPSCEGPSCEMPACEAPSCEGALWDTPAACGPRESTGWFWRAMWWADVCGPDCDGCGTKNGVTREQNRLAAVKARREKVQNKPETSDPDSDAATVARPKEDKPAAPSKAAMQPSEPAGTTSDTEEHPEEPSS